MSRTDIQEKADYIVDFLSGKAGARQIAQFLDPSVRQTRLIEDDDHFLFPASQLTVTYQYWRDLPKVDGIANIERVDPHLLVSALGYVMLVDVDDDDNFTYALYGSKIVAVTGFDMTGKKISDIATTGGIREFFLACYLAAMKLRRPIYTVHEAPPSITSSVWHRVVLPLGRDGTITRFLVCNVPMADGKVR